MCGITGFFSPNGTLNSEGYYDAHRMIKHRGPDDEGFVSLKDGTLNRYKGDDTIEYYNSLLHVNTVDNCSMMLGHRRLSIIDLSHAGHQPLMYKKLTLIYNGEIYNYKELRIELEELGYKFETNTDNEVFLLAYYHFGNACFEKFIGMWAAAIYNNETNELVLCRDFFGIKPLYYYHENDTIIFGSEIKFITHFKPALKSPDSKTIYDFVHHNLKEHSEHTFFKDIKQMLPGSILTFSTNKIDFLKLSIPRNKSINANKSVYDNVSRSIDYHLIADVKVGISLSGGIDSTVIASYMASKKLAFESFSSIFPKNKEFDESKYVFETTNKYREFITKNLIETTLEDSWNSIDETLECLDEPYSGLGMFQPFSVYKKASEKGLKVILGGQGADEIFGGYRAQIADYNKETLMQGGVLGFIKLFLEKKVSKALLKEVLIEKNVLRKPKNINGHFKGKYSETDFDSRTWYFNYGLREYLFYEDRLSMWHSVEGRVPFLTTKLYKLYAGLSYSKITDKGEQKVLLKEAFKAIMPNLVYQRKDKMGYVSPNQLWLNKKKDEIILFLLNSNFYSGKLEEEKLVDFDHNSLWRHYIVALWYDKKILN